MSRAKKGLSHPSSFGGMLSCDATRSVEAWPSRISSSLSTHAQEGWLLLMMNMMATWEHHFLTEASLRVVPPKATMLQWTACVLGDLQGG